ncbi:MAG: DUF6582 domain-containing protein [Candidatus Heimdallarchaeaceae archaeon]
MKVITLESNPLEVKGNKELELPLVLKDKVLLTPGTWNGLFFSKESIKQGFELTDWNDKKNYSLIYDHDEKAINWLGWVLNTRVSEDGSLIGDLEIWDENLAKKLFLAKAKLGISARVLGVEDEEGNFNIKQFSNFSVVYDPACKNAYINLSQSKVKEEILDLKKRLEKIELEVTSSNDVSGSKIGISKNEKVKIEKSKKAKEEVEMKQVSNFEEIRKKMGMSVDEFYAIPRDPPSASKLPIFDAAHVRNALARFNQVKGVSEEEKKKAISKIKSAAKKFGIKISGELNSNLIELKGGLKSIENMEEDEKIEQPVQEEQQKESKEEVVEKQPEESEESKEEAKEPEKEEAESEESKESEELSSKVSLVLSELKKLSERVAVLEDNLKEKAEVKSEELSEKKEANPKSVIDLSKSVKGYTKGDAEFATMLLSKAKL